MPCEESITEAKASFVSAVSDGINVLMNQCGYSRERATSALIRELSRGETTRPSDEEIFQVVKERGLGMEDAAKVLIVTKALKRALSSSGSPAKAIELLASKLSLSNLLYESDEDSGSDDGLLRQEQRAARDSGAGNYAQRPSVTPIARKPRGASKTPKSKQKPAPKTLVAGRKRAIDEISPVEMKNSFHPRPRSDSASYEVDAKIAKQSNDEIASNELLKPASVVRTKRARGTDDSAALNQSGSLKRNRATES